MFLKFWNYRIRMREKNMNIEELCQNKAEWNRITWCELCMQSLACVFSNTSKIWTLNYMQSITCRGSSKSRRKNVVSKSLSIPMYYFETHMDADRTVGLDTKLFITRKRHSNILVLTHSHNNKVENHIRLRTCLYWHAYLRIFTHTCTQTHIKAENSSGFPSLWNVQSH
jgi:hypothetical protein